MGSDICPRCGKAHGANLDFDCSEVSDRPARPADERPTPPSGTFRVEAAPVTRLQPGALVGEYQVCDRIAEGGMGTVYAAVHPIIGKKVAIKVLSGRLAKNSNAIKRFVLEARAVNDIRHPGLVDIFSFGRLTDGRPYYVMEFLDGRSLGAVLRAHYRLLPIDSYHVFLEVGRVLVAVHDHGIIHRDLKPDNVILIPQGPDQPPKVKLVDFGLAKLLVSEGNLVAGGAPHTAVGVNVGTPHYMAPEQCRGGKVDARSDLYALGVSFYETVTGELPIDGPSPIDIWQAHVEVMPRRPELWAPGVVSPELGSLIMRMLAKRPDQRPQNAKEFCQELEALAQAGKLGRPATPPPDEITSPASGLARVLSSTPVSSELEVARPPRRPEPPAAPQPAAQRPVVPKLPQRRDGNRHPIHDPAVQAELATTYKEMPVFVDEPQSPAKHSQEIAGLREALGLHIEVPDVDANDPCQVSAMVVNLERGGPNEAKDALAPGASASILRHRSRPVEERHHLPRLLAPAQKPSKAPQGQPGRARAPSRLGRVLWVGMAVALALGGAAVFWLTR